MENKKIVDESKMSKELREENKKLKSSISCMQSDIADKNSKIAQLTMANVKLATQNSHLTEISTKNKLYKKERGTESEEEDEESEIRNGKRRAEERKGQRKRQRPNEQEKRWKIKCQWHEKGKCNRYECKFRHPRKVCKNYNQDYCELGNKCADNHPKKECTLWTQGECKKGEECNLKHTVKRDENSPQTEQNSSKESNTDEKTSENECEHDLGLEYIVNAVKQGFRMQNDILISTAQTIQTNQYAQSNIRPDRYTTQL